MLSKVCKVFYYTSKFLIIIQAQNKVSCSRILPVHQAVVGRQVAEDAPEKK